MWNKGKTLAVCMFAAAWWGVFYPELYFTEETCEEIQMAEADMAAEKFECGETDGAVRKIEAGEVWQASGDSLVISSRFLEWCEEHLRAGKEK